MLALSASWGASIAQAQFFFESDAVFLNRNNSGGAKFASGGQSINLGKGDYGFEPGYRLGLGWLGEDVQIDAFFTQISPWTSSSSGDLTGNLYFNSDDPEIMALDSELEFPGFLMAAGSNTLGGVIQEGFLQSGGDFKSSSRSNYRDAEINIGTSQYKRPWRMAVGYRNIQLDENSLMSINGEFGTTDNGISDSALAAQGATLISGGGSGIQVDPLGLTPTDMLYSVTGDAKNELNGAQAIFGYRLYDGSWFTVESTLKAGVYRNTITGRVQETVATGGFQDSVYQRTMTGKDSGAAFVGNLGLKAVVGLTDYIDLVLGYEVMFLSGIALGSDQVNGIGYNTAAAPVYRVQNDRSLVANGGTIGLRVYW